MWRRRKAIVYSLIGSFIVPVATNIASGKSPWDGSGWIPWTVVLGLAILVILLPGHPNQPEQQSSRPSPQPSHDAIPSAVLEGPPATGPTKTRRSRPAVRETAAVRTGTLPKQVRGRDSLINKLKTKRRSGGLVVLAGLGGTGKSTIARQLVRSIRSDTRNKVRAWEVSAASPRGLVNGFGTLAETLEATPEELEAITIPDSTGPDNLWQLLEQAPRGWILIIDNADEVEYLAKPAGPNEDPEPTVAEGTGWARASRRGLVIVTSRERTKDKWPAKATIYPVGELKPSQAAQILTDEAPSAGSSAKAKVLAKRLGYLPLALHLAGRYLKSSYAVHTTFDSYQRALSADSTWIRYLDRLPAGSERRMIMRTWELSLDALALHGMPHARPLLWLLSCYAPAVPIPLDLLKASLVGSFLTKAVKPTPGAARPRVDIILQALDQIGLINPTLPTRTPIGEAEEPQARGLVLHPVVADVNRTHLSYLEEEGSGENLTRHTAVQLMAAALEPLDPAQSHSWTVFRSLTPHLQALLGFSAQQLDSTDLNALILLAGETAIAYGFMASAGFGIELIELALSRRQDGASDDTSTLKVREQQGYLLRYESRDAEAEAIFRDILHAKLQTLALDHPDNLVARHNVIASGWRRLDWAEAVSAFDELLRDETRVLGISHDTTFRTQIEFAQMHWAFARWEEAETLLRSTLTDASSIYGERDDFITYARKILERVVVRQPYEAVFATADAGRAFSVIQPSAPVLDEQTAASLFQRGVMLMENAPVESLTIFDNLINEFSTDDQPATRELVGKAMFNKAVSLSKMNRFEESLRTFGTMAKRHSGDSDPHMRELAADALFRQASLLEELEGSEEASAAYEDLIELFEDETSFKMRKIVAEALKRRGACLVDEPKLALRNLMRSLDHYQELDEDYPGEFIQELASARTALTLMRIRLANALFDQAKQSEELNKHEDAIAAYEELYARSDDDPSPALRSVRAKAQFHHACLLDRLGR